VFGGNCKLHAQCFKGGVRWKGDLGKFKVGSIDKRKASTSACWTRFVNDGEMRWSEAIQGTRRSVRG